MLGSVTLSINLSVGNVIYRCKETQKHANVKLLCIPTTRLLEQRDIYSFCWCCLILDKPNSASTLHRYFHLIVVEKKMKHMELHDTMHVVHKHILLAIVLGSLVQIDIFKSPVCLKIMYLYIFKSYLLDIESVSGISR